MADKHTIPVEIEAHGFEDAAEKIELMADAIDSLPATVNIKAKDCEIKVHTTNIVEKQEPFKTYAPGGVIRSKPDYEPEPEEDIVLRPAGFDVKEFSDTLSRSVVRDISKMCAGRPNCAGCIFNTGIYEDTCKLKGLPGEWLI